MVSGSYLCEICQQRVTQSRYRQFRTCYRNACRSRWKRDFWLRVRKGHLNTRADIQLAAKTLVHAARRLWDVAFSKHEPVVVPANQRELVDLQEQRLQGFHTVLVDLIGRAAAQRNQDSTGTPPAAQTAATKPTLPILQEACATCRGHCCFAGNATALLTVDTITRFMREQPGLTPKHVLEAYLSKLPLQSYDQSCFYHSESGCTLPRNMRSDKCDAFYCDNLKAMSDTSAPGGWLIIAASGKTPSRFTIVDPSPQACSEGPEHVGHLRDTDRTSPC